MCYNTANTPNNKPGNTLVTVVIIVSSMILVACATAFAVFFIKNKKR